MFDGMGKTLIIFGVILIGVGLVMQFGGKFLDLGHLPGDFKWSSGNSTFYFPLASCIIISIILNIIFSFFK